MDETKKVEPSPETKTSSQEEILEKIELATRKLEEANKRFEHERALAQAEKVSKQLDGVAEGGNVVKPEMSNAEYAEKILAGEKP